MSLSALLLTSLVATGAAGSMAATALSHLCVHLELRRRTVPTHAPPVSILKPLKGIDDELEENLASMASQVYPGPFELILGAADPDDPAMDVAVRIRRRFPHVKIKTVSGRPRPGLNPKVANLTALAEVAEHDVILISDSNVRVEPHYLRSIAQELSDPEVGLVSNVMTGVGERTLGAALENLHLNSFVAGAVCGADLVAKHPVVVGKSMLMRRRDLDRLGGFARVANVLGEDYVLGTAFARAGYRVVLSPHVIHTVNRQWGVRRFASRHLRWSQLRRWVAPRAYACEPLLNPLPWLMALALLTWMRGGSFGQSWSTWAIGLCSAGATKIASDAVLSRRLRGRWPGLLGLSAVPIKDLLVLMLWGLGWVKRTVHWRGNQLRIGRGSALLPLHANPDAELLSPERPAPAAGRS